MTSADENRELKVSSNLQLTTGNNEITIKESSFHQGIAVPMTMEEYEKEMAREKDLIAKAKKKIAVESSTPRDGISTWILLSGSNNPTTRPEIKPAFRIDSAEKKPVKNMNNTLTTKKRNPVTTTTKLPKATPKYNNNKVITRVKVSTLNESKNETNVEVTTKAQITTKKPQLTTKAKKYLTTRAKTTTVSTTPSTTTTEAVEIVDDETEEEQTAAPTETSTFLIMEAKDADFNLPNDRAPSKASPTKKFTKTGTSTKLKKKKIVLGSTNGTTNSTRIKKKSDKKTSLTKLSSKTPEKPISTQIYNYLAREVMPTVGVGLVGLVVTAGLATYFLGGPLTALRRSYDISNRRDDVAYDRSDEFGNTQAEEEMFGKVIAGMPENSAYRNNIRVSSYRPKPYSGYSQYNQMPKYNVQQQQQQQLRYRAVDPYQNSYQTQSQYPQYYQQQQQPSPAQVQAKSAVTDYSNQQQQAQVQQTMTQAQQPEMQIPTQNTQNNQKFNIDTVDMTTSHPPEQPVYNNADYDEIAQSYFPHQDQTQHGQVSIEQQKMQEIDDNSQNEVPRSERVTIVQAQSVPSNHKSEIPDKSTDLPTPAALTYTSADEEYQNSIANAIMNQKKQFVVGSVVAENFEETPQSAVPEHGPRRRRQAIKKAAKSLDNNEIDEDTEIKRDNIETSTTAKPEEVSTSKREESSSKKEPESPPIQVSESTSEQMTLENHAETTTQYPNFTYNIESTQNNIFHLFRRIIDLKVRLGLNFLQNATLAFQHYLQGVEQRVRASPLFNPYVKNETTSNDTTLNSSQHSNKIDRKTAEAL